jgi:hypothetical protein
MTPKEVAPVNSIKNSMWTDLTSAFGMSICGRTRVITRDQAVAATKGHVALVEAYVPGTNAWSPPTC